MKLIVAAVLFGIAAFALVGAFVGAGVDVAAAVREVGVPLVLASAAGALIWSWAEPR